MEKVARLFKNGSIASAESSELVRADVLVGALGNVQLVQAGITAEAGIEVVDCTDCVLVPGMFDVHVHAREPGEEHKETLATCAAAALRGGITGLVLMPDTAPPVDSGNLVKSVADLVSELGLLPMLPAGCLTKGRAGNEMAGYAGMASRGVALLTDADRPVPCPELMRRCLEYANDFDLLIASHCETPALSRGGSINEGRMSYRLGLPGIPAISQEIGIDRDLRIARHTGARLHVQQVSTAAGLSSVVRAKEAGARVSCEISPHHLVLSEMDIPGYNTHFKFNPPLRAPEDPEALVEGFCDGSIDLLASDHAPHTEFEKSSEFALAPFGAAGLETAVPVIYDRFIRRGRFGWQTLIERYCVAPRRLLGIAPVRIAEGERAEFFVFDVQSGFAVSRGSLRTKSPVTPFLGETLAGRITGTQLGNRWHPHD